MACHQKKIPHNPLIFGAGRRTGSHVAKAIQHLQPGTQLRLATTNESGVSALQEVWPLAEVVVADFFQEPSLHKAVRGMEGVVIVTTGSFDERLAMNNMVKAPKESLEKLVLVIRFTVMFPGFDPRRVPKSLTNAGLVLPLQSHYAKEILDESLVPSHNCQSNIIDCVTISQLRGTDI